MRASIAAADDLLRLIATRPVDVNDPDWMAKLQAAPPAVDEAGVRAETTAALEVLLEAYETASLRAEVREIFRAYPSFRWAVGLPMEWATAAEFRRRLILVSARDQGADPRDELVEIWALCARARELGIDVEPVLGEVADMSADVDHYGFGSMRTLITRGREG
ncbi:hypothetical protein BJ973_003393 [Actinoplanes tereljensis]|uniref:hypothetical protein n=1 Tax=Paractinoplanes tereljensis TaxID=571912 RepID=UPI001942CB41|nr:hypothetical protein [Actinoplanes tereljensis]